MADQLSAHQLIPPARQLIPPARQLIPPLPPRWSRDRLLWRSYRAEGWGDCPADGWECLFCSQVTLPGFLKDKKIILVCGSTTFFLVPTPSLWAATAQVLQKLHFEPIKLLNFDLIQIRIQLCTLMRIRIQLPKIMRIRNPFNHKHWYLSFRDLKDFNFKDSTSVTCKSSPFQGLTSKFCL